MKIEHQRRERERIAARQELERQRSRRHAPGSASLFKTRLPYHPPRCSCGLPLHKAGRSRFLGFKTGRVYTMFPNTQCYCESGYRHRQRKAELLKEIEETRKTSSFGKCPTLFRNTMEIIRNPKKVQVPCCSCTADQETLSNVTLVNSTINNSSCHCFTTAQHRRLEEDLGRWVERLHRSLIWRECAKKAVNRTRRHSIEDAAEVQLGQDDVIRTPNAKQLPRSGRSKGGFGFNFGRRTGVWGTGNWRIVGRQNNANTGGLWGRALPALGTSLFGNRGGTNTPPRSDSMPDLSLSGLNARLLNLRRTPSATDLTRTNPTSASRTSSTATLVDVTPNSPSVLPSGSTGRLSRTASQEVASLTGTLPASPPSALSGAPNDLYMRMASFRPINPARDSARSSATGASSSVRASTGGAASTSTSMEMTPMANRPLPATPSQNIRLSSTSSSSGAETAIPVGEPIYPNYRDFSSVTPEHMKWHDVVGSKWRHWGHRHPYLQGGMGLAGTSAMSGGVFLAMQALSNKMLNPGPDAELVKANQQLSTNLGEVTNRLHQEVGKSALATDVLVNAVHTGDVPAAVVEEAKAIQESRAVKEKKKVTTSSTRTLQVTTTPATKKTTVTTVTPPPDSPNSRATGADLPDSIWDIRGPYADKETQTPNERTLIVPDDRSAHHQLYQRFGRAIYDPWWRPPEHLKVTDPYHFRLGLMAPAILASLEQEHPPAARYPLQHEYDRAHGPRGYNPYLIIPKGERDRLMMQSVEDGQVNLQKYGQLLEDAALKYQLDYTKGKNVPLVTEPPTEASKSIDLSELQAKLRKVEEEALGVPDASTEATPAKPGTWINEDQPQQVTPTPATATAESQWKPLPTPKTRKRPRHRKRKHKMEPLPEPEALSSDQWIFKIDLSTDKNKTLFALGVMFLLGMIIIVIYLIGICFRRLGLCCKKIFGGYKLAATDSDRVTPAEWELQELNYY